MWILCGFITFISIFCYSLRRKISASWSSTKGATKDKKIEYEYCISNKKSLLFIGTKAPKNIDFVLKPENKTDLFFKKIGISVEMQLGNKEVDEKIYFATDNDALFEIFKKSQKLQNFLLKIIHSVASKDSKFKAISCRGGRIWIEVNSGKIDDSVVEKLAEEIAPILTEISSQLDRRNKIIVKRGDKFAIKAAAILSVSSAAAIFDLAWALFNRFTFLPKITDSTLLVIHSSIIGFVMMIVMVFLTLKLLKKTSRAHLVLIELILVGSISFSVAGGILLRDINIEYDQSPTSFFSSAIKNKYYSRSRRGGTHYYLTVSNHRGLHKIEVDNFLFEVAKIGNFTCLQEREGLLGYRWISGVRIGSCS